MAVETYEDGSYCIYNADGSGGCWTADGYQTDAWEAPAVDRTQHQGTDIFSAIGNWISAITGNYPNQYQGQYHPAVNYQGVPLPQGRCDGIQIGGSVSALGGGSTGGFCLSKTLLIFGGAATAFFLFGQRRGRR